MDSPELFNLNGKVAVVTGGGRGIGKQIAIFLAERGCHVILCSRDKETCDQTANEISKKYNVKSRGYEVDVTNEEQVEKFIQEALLEFNKIDILINNSGVNFRSPIEDMPLREWNNILNVNVTGVFILCKIVGKHMMERKYGKIINIASAAGLAIRRPEVANTIAYSTSKAAVIHFTKELAMKWAQYNINVNAIAPGTLKTTMTEKLISKKEKVIIESIPLKRIGDVQMLKGAVLYLAADESDFVTGTVMSVDGGSSL